MPTNVWPLIFALAALGTAIGAIILISEHYSLNGIKARTVGDGQIVAPLKKVIRVANEEDLRRAESNEKREREAFELCQERIARHKLEMKLVSVEYTFDNNKIIFYFTANGRVDFRDR